MKCTLIALLVVMLALTGVATAQTETITVQFWHTRGSGANYDVVLASVDAFNATVGKGKNIVVEETYIGNYNEILTKTQLAIQAGEQVHIVVIGNTIVGSLIDDGLLADRMRYAEKTGFAFDNLMTPFQHIYGNTDGTLSGGQRQRVALARAMVKQPKVFLMDEPLSNLDAKLRVTMRVELIELHRRLNTTFVYVTHDQVEAMSMADIIMLMDQGKVVQEGTPEQVCRDPKDWSTDALMVLPGYELTLSAGHYNVFGIREFQRKFDMNKAELAEYFVYLKGLGALIQLDHPNADPYGSRYGYELDVDMLEVINGNVNADALTTLEDYQQLLTEGRRLIAIANTDAHRDHAGKQLHNLVLATERTQAAVLIALRKGHTSIRVSMDAPIISLGSGDAIMGDTIQYADGQQVMLTVTGLKPASEIRVYTQAGAAVHLPEGDSFTLSMDTKGASFVRAEVWRGGMPQAISNPIYIMQ